MNGSHKIKRFNLLVKGIKYTGIGKPEQLKHKDIEIWSRRIDGEYKIVYEISEVGIEIIQCINIFVFQTSLEKLG